jgi:hypothetical protein
LAKRSDVLTFEGTVKANTAFESNQLGRWHVTPPRKLLVHSVDVQGYGDVEIQILDYSKERAVDLNVNARKVRFMPFRYPVPLEIAPDHDLVIYGKVTGADEFVRGKVEVEWVE